MKYYSPTDVSKVLGISTYHLHNAMAKGTIPFPIRIRYKSTKLWYNQSDVNKLKRALKYHSNGFKGSGYYWVQRGKHQSLVWMQEPNMYLRVGSNKTYRLKLGQRVIGPIKPKKVKS